jgi:hypothetical protein
MIGTKDLERGGDIQYLNEFQDDWAQMLVNNNKAKVFKISGSWRGPNKKYTFSSGWLNLPLEQAHDYVSVDYLSPIDRLYDVFIVP